MKKLNLTNLGSAVAIAVTLMVGGMTVKAMDTTRRDDMLRARQMKAQDMGRVMPASRMNLMGYKITNG